jgi:glycosyltransferase involved in cell wall biosynthesis
VRLAFLSPLPPAPTGIADYAATVLTMLADRHDIDLFHDQQRVDRSGIPGTCDVQPAHVFPDRHRERPYDLAVYQMGNGRAHEFLYPHLSRIPGLLVLHDLVLHHSRAAHFLESDPVRAWRLDPANPAAREAARPWLDRWRAELTYTYPEKAERLFAAQLGTVGDLLPYAYPLLRIPVEASRLVAVHNTFMVDAVRAEVPGADVVRVPQPASAETVDRAAVDAVRRRLGFADDHVVVGAFGLLTPEKRIETVARAVARTADDDPRIRLLLAGPVPDAPRLAGMLERLGVAERSVVTGRLPLEELAPHIEAADILVHLRYPTARETSGALLRVLAQGRPTVISDLAHQDDIPRDAVMRADVADEVRGVTRALRRLAGDPQARRALGQRAAEYIRREYAPERTREAWEAALERARRCPAPPPRDWPAHWPRP